MPSDRVRLETVLQQLQADYSKMGSRLAEIVALLQDELTPNQRAKRLLDSFCTKWEARRGRKYIVTGPKDLAICKRLMDVPDVLGRLDRFLASSDAFVVGSGYALPVFERLINQYGQREMDATAAVPPEVEAVCLKAGLGRLQIATWFTGASWQPNGGPLPTITLTNAEAFGFVVRCHGDRLAPYAVLKLQEGA